MFLLNNCCRGFLALGIIDRNDLFDKFYTSEDR